MARGWESKAVESQQADSGARVATKPQATPEELERRRQAHSIALAMAETTAQLQTACRPAHREMLHGRMAALQDLLRALEAPPDGGPP